MILLGCGFLHRVDEASSVDSCVESLLDASVRYAPHFDWVVAHLGYVSLHQST